MPFFATVGVALGATAGTATATAVGAAATGSAVLGAASLAQGFASQADADAAQRRQNGIIKTQKQMAAEQHGIYDEFGRPVQEEAFRQARSGVLPEFYEDRARADISQRFGVAEQAMERNLNRRGIGMQAGSAQQLAHNVLMAKATAEAAASTGARRQAEDVNWRRVLQGYNMGQTTLGNATGQYQNVSNAYGNQAAQHQASADGAFAAAGNMLGGMGQTAQKQAINGFTKGRQLGSGASAAPIAGPVGFSNSAPTYNPIRA